MPYSLEDLDRLKVRVGTGEKSLRQLSDNQFTAWLRLLGAVGTIAVVKIGPGKFATPLEERVRILNELEAAGFDLSGTSPVATRGQQEQRPGMQDDLSALHAALQAAARQLEIAQGLAQELGEISAPLNLRQSLSGALALVDACRGAAERALRLERSPGGAAKGS
jgi:hypothetical protein